MSDNRRRAPRKDAFKIGALAVDGCTERLECLVWDVSEVGATIEVDGDAVVPDRFTLLIGAYEPPRTCSAVRREGRRLGIRFDR